MCLSQVKRFVVKIVMSDRKNYLISNNEWAVTNLIFCKFEHHFEINMERNGNNFFELIGVSQLVFDFCDYKIGCTFDVDVDAMLLKSIFLIMQFNGMGEIHILSNISDSM